MTDHEKRIGAFLDERGKMHGLCPEQIAGANESPLLVADLRTLLADLDEARAALTAAKAVGWVAVPVEPTEEMLDAAFAYETQAGGIQGGDVVDAYKAMLAARPLPNPPKEQ